MVDCPSLSALCNHLSREPLIQKRLHNPNYINSSSFRCCSHPALNNNTIYEQKCTNLHYIIKLQLTFYRHQFGTMLIAEDFYVLSNFWGGDGLAEFGHSIIDSDFTTIHNCRIAIVRCPQRLSIMLSILFFNNLLHQLLLASLRPDRDQSTQSCQHAYF